MKKNSVLILLLSTFSLVSCSNSNDKKVINCDLIGDLEHIQYWNKYDKWDMSSLSLAITYEDNSVKYLKGDSSLINYNFYPESPNGLEIGVTKLKIYDSFYLDDKNNKHQIPDREFANITIIDYPYNNTPRELYDSGIVGIYIVPSFIAISIIGLSIGLVARTFKRKEVKQND